MNGEVLKPAGTAEAKRPPAEPHRRAEFNVLDNDRQVSLHIASKSLMDMAKRRGLHASQYEAEQAWQQVSATNSKDRLILAWKSLYRGHAVAGSTVGLLSPSQLPAWVIVNNSMGIIQKLASGENPISIQWFGSVPDKLPVNPEVLVPVAPMLDSSAESFLKEQPKGQASEAIRVGMKAHKGLLGRVALVSVFINLIAVVSSLFVMQVYDRVVPNFAYATLWFLAVGMLVMYIFDVLFKLVRHKLMDAVSKRLDEALSLFIFERLLGLKLDRRSSRQGSLVAQVRDYESVKQFFTSSTLFALVDLPFVILFVGVIYMIAGPVAYVPLAFVGFSAVIGILAYKPLARIQQENNDAVIRRQGMLFEVVSCGEVVKSQGGEAKFSDAWLNATRETCDRGEELNYISTLVQILTSFFQQASYVCMIIVGVYVIEAGGLTVGGLIACSILGGRALASISGISGLLVRWHHANYSLKILNQLLSAPSDNHPNRESNTYSMPLDLELKEVKYAYTGSHLPQFSAESLRILAGSKVAVLGRNGCGKSTLLKLLAGIATPNQGEVRIAGLNYENCRLSWLREVIGYLPQEPRLVSGTLLDNLTLGISMPSEEEIVAALEKTGLIEAVQAHPMGLQLPIAEGGAGMSGGQRQAVGLTRLVLQKPKIWLLDEPAASLDSVLEQKVIDIIIGLPSDTTVIFTTHKQSWVNLATRGFIIHNAEIVKELLPEAAAQNTEQPAVKTPSVVNVGGVK